jgi:hypothetical protein
MHARAQRARWPQARVAALLACRGANKGRGPFTTKQTEQQLTAGVEADALSEVAGPEMEPSISPRF